MTLGEVLALGGVLLSAGAALERMRRIENSNRDQGRRIGRLEDKVTEIETDKRVRAELEHRQPPARHRALGAPVPRDEDR